jgi:hypothetical protein
LLHEAGGDEVEGFEGWVAVCGGGGGGLHLPCGWNFPLLPQVDRGSTFALRRPNSRLLSRWAAFFRGWKMLTRARLQVHKRVDHSIPGVRVIQKKREVLQGRWTLVASGFSDKIHRRCAGKILDLADPRWLGREARLQALCMVSLIWWDKALFRSKSWRIRNANLRCQPGKIR